MSPNPEQILEVLSTLVPKLGKVLGPQTEVVLHDLRNPESSIVAICHGEITGRNVGDSSTNLVLDILQDPYADHDRYHYQSRTKTGRPLKCSSVYFKDPEGRTFAALCINQEIGDLLMAVHTLTGLVATDEEVNEQFGTSIEDVIGQLIQDGLALVRKPVQFMSKEEKLRVVEFLHQQGVFHVRRAAARVAEALGTSKVTVYTYLNEIQSQPAVDGDSSSPAELPESASDSDSGDNAPSGAKFGG